MQMLLFRFVMAAALLLLATWNMSGHEPGLSTMQVRVLKDSLDATLVFSAKEARELARKDAGAIQGDALAEIFLQERAAAATRFTIDGQPVAAGEAVCDFDEEGNASLRFQVQRTPRRTLEIQSRWLAALPAGHRQFVSIVKEPSIVLSEQLLSATSDSVKVELAENGAESAVTKSTGTWPEFVGLGLKHILIGFDHLLFLFSLVIVSRRLVPTVQLITCFTVAHSITLALATFDLVRIPARVVEPLIAASIIFVAVENLTRRDAPKSRPWLVFGFGLIHGLGFASVLRDLGVGVSPSGVFAPLLAFNLGVELGQLLVVLLVAPLLFWAGQSARFERRLVPVASVLIAGAGAFWLVERLFANA